MAGEVYANSDEIACKAGDGKVIAAFPDVCLSPPSPPAGPVPLPYPNTSFSKDMQNGSKTVVIKDKEVMLKDQSFYKTSPLGDEAATNGLGASVVTHVITGKTYFVAWSMDVQFEGQNVDRHSDLTTSNHASQPGSTPPNPNLEALEMGALEKQENECGCCGAKPKHVQNPAAKEMTFNEFYGLNETDASGAPTPKALSRQAFVEKVKNKKANGCTCTKPTKLLPEAPCNVFRKPVTKDEHKKIKKAHKKNADKFRQHHKLPTYDEVEAAFPSFDQNQIEAEVKINHLVPKNAGGCPGKTPDGEGNLQSNYDLCDTCRGFDKKFGDWQSEISTI